MILAMLIGTQRSISRRPGESNEVKEIAKDLSDPTKDSVYFTTQLFKLVRLYKLSAAEVTHLPHHDETAMSRRERRI